MTKHRGQEVGRQHSSDTIRYPKRAHAVKVAESSAPSVAPSIEPAVNPLAKLGSGYALVSLEWLNAIMSDPAIMETLARHEATRQHLEWRARASDETKERPVNRAIEQAVKGARAERVGRAMLWTLAKNAKAPSSRSESASRIYRYLVEHSQGATVRELMDALHMPLSTVQNGLRQLQYAGIVNQSAGR